MKALVGFVCALSILQGSPALALNCGSRLVREGQSSYEVLQACGPPTWRSSRVAYIAERLGDVYREIPVDVDEWIYNLGPTRLMQKLIFENDRLMRVKALGYGN